MYEVKNISTNTLSSPVQEVGTYTIPVAGKYQIRLMGEAGTTAAGAGGILIANTYYDVDTLITLKGIKGAGYTSTQWAGAGIALWDDGLITTNAPKLAAGGGAKTGAGGYLGGNDTGNPSSWKGYSWDGTRGGNASCCVTPPCNNGATGGCGHGSDQHYGGSGTGSSGYPCPTGYTCTTITGGNFYSYQDYPATIYGNWVNSTLTGGKDYAAIVYCGPDASSTCPASCDVNTACTTGSCNYHTGLCE